MADNLSQEQRSLNMSRVRGKDTGPEKTVRGLLHGRGFRYRLHRRDLPGRPDIVMPRYRAVIFVHGCFWHGHSCSLFRMPATRTEFWKTKITANSLRDENALNSLREAGWRSLWVWECALRGRGKLSPDKLAAEVIGFVKSDAFFAAIEETRAIAS